MTHPKDPINDALMAEPGLKPLDDTNERLVDDSRGAAGLADDSISFWQIANHVGLRSVCIGP